MENVFVPKYASRYNFINESICKNKEGIMVLGDGKVFIPHYSKNIKAVRQNGLYFASFN